MKEAWTILPLNYFTYILALPANFYRMAKQTGKIRITGTLSGLSFYRMFGDYFVRRTSSLDGNRVKTDEAFANSRKRMTGFGEAAGICKEVYGNFDKRYKKHGVFGKMTGRANIWLIEGKDETEVRALLLSTFGNPEG